MVFNGVNMTALAPENSYIDIKDFENIKGIPSPKSIQIIHPFIIFLDAAMFLLKVSEDKEAYSSYFWWRQFYTFTQGNSKVSISTLIPLLHLTMLLIANRARNETSRSFHNYREGSSAAYDVRIISFPISGLLNMF